MRVPSRPKRPPEKRAWNAVFFWRHDDEPHTMHMRGMLILVPPAVIGIVTVAMAVEHLLPCLGPGDVVAVRRAAASLAGSGPRLGRELARVAGPQHLHRVRHPGGRLHAAQVLGDLQ